MQMNFRFIYSYHKIIQKVSLISLILVTYYNAPRAEDDLLNAFHHTIIR